MTIFDETWTAEIHSNACDCSSRVVVVTDREHTIPRDSEYFYANDGGRANYMVPRLQLAAAAPDLYRGAYIGEGPRRLQMHRRARRVLDARQRLLPLHEAV